jgi:hypothetical protein
MPVAAQCRVQVIRNDHQDIELVGGRNRLLEERQQGRYPQPTDSTEKSFLRVGCRLEATDLHVMSLRLSPATIAAHFSSPARQVTGTVVAANTATVTMIMLGGILI